LATSNSTPIYTRLTDATQNSGPWRRLSTLDRLRRRAAGHGRWPHAGIDLARHPIGLHHVRAVVETAGLPLHDEKPERISRLFDETIANCSFGSGRPWACGKCRQRSLKSPSKPSERRRPLLGNFVFEGCPSGTKRIQRHRARSDTWPAIAYLLVGKGCSS
jgi:hypothetical protein